MIFGSNTLLLYARRSKPNSIYECPHTVVYSIDIPSANHTYDFAYYQISAMYTSGELAYPTMDWGDGSSGQLIIDEYDNHYHKFSHTYAESGTYTLTFDNPFSISEANKNGRIPD